MTPMIINSDEYFTEYCIRPKYIFILLFSVCFLIICFVRYFWLLLLYKNITRYLQGTESQG